MKLLITCVPMILRIKEYDLSKYDVTIPEFTQTMSEERLIEIISDYEYWIAGDDPVTRKVLEKAKKLKMLVKWGIGIDNIDLDAIKDLHIPFSNTPGMFGNEVADVAIGYLLMITRKLHQINNQVKKGNWYKPAGISLKSKKVGLIGFGDIGRNISDRLLSLKCNVHVHDPGFEEIDGIIKSKYTNLTYPNKVKIEKDVNNVFQGAKIIILACAANKDNYHLINKEKIQLLEDKSYIVNVSRGSLVDESCIVEFLNNGKLEAFASDVFENEPISNHEFMKMENVILGSHNASNTMEAVDRTSLKAIELLNQ